MGVRKLKKPTMETPIPDVDTAPVPDIMSGLTDVEAETVERILSETMNLETNRGSKSRIPVPLNTARLQAMVEIVELEGYPKFGKFLKNLEGNIRENQVSEDGERVKEVIRALSESLKKDRESDRFATPPPE
jgi:hypothetical protein